MILEQFDSCREALFNPGDIYSPIPGFPKTLVTCFAHNLVEYASQKYPTEIVGYHGSCNGKFPIYRVQFGDCELGLTITLVGAAAAVAQYEELFAMGAERIIVFGTCGVLDRSIASCEIILPDRAVRDEGTSYHYAPASDEIAVNESSLPFLREFLDSMNVRYTLGKVWTTDAIYRETREKITLRKAQGCVCVDMECSALAALSQFRSKPILQFFYAADNLDCEQWDKRSLANHEALDEKYAIVDLALLLASRAVEPPVIRCRACSRLAPCSWVGCSVVI